MNVLLHTQQEEGCGPVCMLHIQQENGNDPLCIRECVYLKYVVSSRMIGVALFFQ